MYVPRPGAVPVPPPMAELGLGERPGAFKIKYDLRQMDVESIFTLFVLYSSLPILMRYLSLP